MPTFLEQSGYKVYIWSGEADEPIHFHITKGSPSQNDTKVWVLSNYSLMICHNKSKIPQKDLSRILAVMQLYVKDFVKFYEQWHKTIKFYE